MKNCDCKELALKKVRINGDVIGKFGTFEIEQTFQNNTKDVLNVGYTFPIVETATVVGFEINIGDKVLKGQCKETKKAKKEFQKNIVKGNSAYLMEEKNDNIFAITIGKLDKNEEVTVKIKYIDKFEIVDNTIQLLIPTLVAPRYKSKITNKLKYGKVKYTVDFNINVTKNLNAEKIYSSTHCTNIYNEDDKTRVEVTDYDMSKDFKLNINLKNEAVSNALIFKGRYDGDEYLYMSFMPEIENTYEDSEKEYIFLIDVSGSMDGEKLEETKRAVVECLNQLDEGDKFNIIAFESDYKVISMNSMECNEKNIKMAVERLSELEAGGGTEILDPIKFALYEKDTEKVVLLFTDGEVGNEDEVINFVENNINKSRIFPFGIDYNVNSYFIKELAKVGQGKAEFIQPHEKIDEKIIRTFARIQTPLVENIQVDYGSNKLVDEIKEDSSLFNYEYYNVFSCIENLTDDIVLKGMVSGKEQAWTIKKEEVIRTDVDLEVLFAQMQIERLEKYIRNTNDEDQIENYKEMIVEISEKYNINSKYTSFLTVYERDNKVLELPKYQETVLSRRNVPTLGISNLFNFFSAADEMCDDGPVEYCCCKKVLSYPKKTNKITNNFVECQGSNNNNNTDFKEDLKEKIEKLYQEFLSDNNKSSEMYLLFAIYEYLYLYYMPHEFYNFLDKNKDIIIEDGKCQNIIYGIYKQTVDEHLLDYMSEKYKKAVMTNLTIDVEYNILSDEKLGNICKKGTIKENLKDILWTIYITDKRHHDSKISSSGIWSQRSY